MSNKNKEKLREALEELQDKIKQKENKTSGGTSILLPGLQILFLYLKLTGAIQWSWLAVLAPTWVPIAFIFTLALIALACILYINKYK